MSVRVQIVDEVNPGKKEAGWALELLREHTTARELIRSRVYQEVSEYSARAAGHFRGLVQPTEAERKLNGYSLKPGRKIDWQAQYETAIEVFKKHGFLLLVDDRQLADLDEEIDIHAGTEVTFLRLVPLVGG